MSGQEAEIRVILPPSDPLRCQVSVEANPGMCETCPESQLSPKNEAKIANIILKPLRCTPCEVPGESPVRGELN